ncbi:endonuclease [bacterium]|nr:endonuclease [bacterium]
MKVLFSLFLLIFAIGCSEDSKKTESCDPNPCLNSIPHKTVCVPEGDSFVCNCDSGYVANGISCVESTTTCEPACSSWQTCNSENVCELTSGRCESNSDCTDGKICNSSHNCVTESTDAENSDATCSDGIDNDNNGHTDCEDWGCTRNSAVTVCGDQENTDQKCSDGIDNDNNGFKDCADFSCSKNSAITVCGSEAEDTPEKCNDYIDNDNNGFVDCEDYACSRGTTVTFCANNPCEPNPCTATNKTSCGVVDPLTYKCYCSEGYIPQGTSCVAATYGNIYDNLGDSRDAELIEKLYNIIKDHNALGYDSAKDKIFDFDNNICAYTSQSGASSCEHAWPQSYFGESSPMKSDMHHLFTTTNQANSRRGNVHFGEVVKTDCPCTTPEEPWYCDWDGAGTAAKKGKPSSRCTDYSIFEPQDSKKGDIARALFYFAVRYKDESINQSQAGGTGPDNINHIPLYEERVLRRWHAMDPVDDVEMRRNNMVDGYQHNRNPFVDRPDLVERITDF